MGIVCDASGDAATLMTSARSAARTGMTLLFCAIGPRSVENLCKNRGRPVHALSAIHYFSRPSAQIRAVAPARCSFAPRFACAGEASG